MEEFSKLDYYKQYYHNKYKDIISTKKQFCQCCQLEFSSWNIYKHTKTKKHLLNSMNEEDKQNYLEEKSKTKILKKINKLQQLL
jgi:hypothetical protein